MKTTLGDLRSKGFHIGSGTEFLVNSQGKKFFRTRHSLKIIGSDGQHIVGEVVARCYNCSAEKPISKMYITMPDRETGEHVGQCCECHKDLALEDGGCHERDCPVCRSAA